MCARILSAQSQSCVSAPGVHAGLPEHARPQYPATETAVRRGRIVTRSTDESPLERELTFPLEGLLEREDALGEVAREVRRHLERQDWRGAAVALRRAEKGVGKAAEAYTALAWLWLLLGQPRQAEKLFRRSLDLDPNDAAAHHGLARVALARRDARGAEEHLRRATALQPRHPLYWADLGTLYFNQGRFAEAEEALKRAVALAPDDAQSHALLGYIAYLRGDLGAARQAFEAACTHEPENPGHYNNLGFLHLLEGNLDAAREAFARAIELRPRFIRGLYNRALVYWLDGDRDQAIELYARARELDTDGDDLREHLADLDELWETGALAGTYRDRLQELRSRFREIGHQR